MSTAGAGPDSDPSAVRRPRRARDLLFQLGERGWSAPEADALPGPAELAADQHYRTEFQHPADRRRAIASHHEPLLEGDPATVVASAPEPPPHLAGALKAAAAARARAARIRAGQLLHEAEDAVRWELRASAEFAGAYRSKPARTTKAQKRRFTRTVAAANQARSLASGSDDDPWQLRLRDESARNATASWLSRLLKPLSPDRKRAASGEARLAIPPLAAVAEPSSPAQPARIEPVGREQGAARAGQHYTAAERAWASVEPAALFPPDQASTYPAVLRLPPLGGRRLHPDAEPRALPSGAFGAFDDQDMPPLGGESAPPPSTTRPRRVGAREGRRGAIGFDVALRSHDAGAGQPHDDLADSPPARDSGWAGDVLDYPILPIESRSDQLPALLIGAPPASRLVDVLAGKASAADSADEDGAGAPTPPPSAQPAVNPFPERSAWALAIPAAIAAGFALGIVANAGLLLTGSRLGQVLLAFDAPAREQPADPRPGPDPTQNAKQPTDGGSESIPPSAPVQGPAVGSQHPDQGVIGVGLGVMAETNPSAPMAAPPQAKGSEARADSSAVVKGLSDRERSAGASAERPVALEAKALAWDALYARGHRFQLEGNLVAAADAYRLASHLNPQQAAIQYDLGYVLQMQGQGDAAIEAYRRAIARQPRHAYAHYNLGTLLQEKGDPQEAIGHYEIAAEIQPRNAYIYYDWARSLEAIGDAAGAAALYRKAIALDPDHRPGVDARRRLAALGAPGGDRPRIE